LLVTAGSPKTHQSTRCATSPRYQQHNPLVPTLTMPGPYYGPVGVFLTVYAHKAGLYYTSHTSRSTKTFAFLVSYVPDSNQDRTAQRCGDYLIWCTSAQKRTRSGALPACPRVNQDFVPNHGRHDSRYALITRTRSHGRPESLPNKIPQLYCPQPVELFSIEVCLTGVWSVAAFTEQPVPVPIKSGRL